MDALRLSLWAVAFVAGFVWMGFALGAVLTKLAVPRASAWVPVGRYVAAARAAELPTAPVWVSRGLAAAGWLTFFVIAVARLSDAGAGSAALGGVAAAGLVIGLVGSLVGWVLWIVGANRIELRLVVERRLWWLAALLPPLWATIIGFGSSRSVVVGPVTGTMPVTEPLEDDATRAIQRVTVSVAAGPQTAETPLVGEASMTIDEYDVTGEYPRAFSPYDKLAQAGAAVRDPEDSAVRPVEPWDDDDDTIFTQRRRARWVLKVKGGEEYDLDDITTIGREGIRPIPGVLPIVDDTRTMSKLHARLRRESENWFITDLGSTNGTFVRDAAGSEIEVKAQSEAKVDGTLLLGDLEVVIVDQREVA